LKLVEGHIRPVHHQMQALDDMRLPRVSKRVTPRCSCGAGVTIVAVNNSARA